MSFSITRQLLRYEPSMATPNLMNLGQWELQPFVVLRSEDVQNYYSTRTDTNSLRLLRPPTLSRMVNRVPRIRRRGLGACHNYNVCVGDRRHSVKCLPAFMV